MQHQKDLALRKASWCSIHSNTLTHHWTILWKPICFLFSPTKASTANNYTRGSGALAFYCYNLWLVKLRDRLLKWVIQLNRSALCFLVSFCSARTCQLTVHPQDGVRVGVIHFYSNEECQKCFYVEHISSCDPVHIPLLIVHTHWPATYHFVCTQCI